MSVMLAKRLGKVLPLLHFAGVRSPDATNHFSCVAAPRG